MSRVSLKAIMVIASMVHYSMQCASQTATSCIEQCSDCLPSAAQNGCLGKAAGSQGWPGQAALSDLCTGVCMVEATIHQHEMQSLEAYNYLRQVTPTSPALLAVLYFVTS